MISPNAWLSRVFALAIAAAPLAGCAPASSDAADAEEVESGDAPLRAGGTIEWDHFSAGPRSKHAGIDERFRAVDGDDAHFWISQDHEQKFRFGWDGKKNNDGDVRLLVANLEAAPGQFYKGWLLGTVEDSNNKGIGFCGFGTVNGNLKAPFRSQLQMQFFKGNDKLAGCYCNLCPVGDGHEVACATDQWHLHTEVSDDGACRAPDGAEKVTVTIEAVAKAATDELPGGVGTAVIHKFRFARCDNDGVCKSEAPNWFTN